MLDLTKPLQLSDGRPARLLAMDLPGSHPIAAWALEHVNPDEACVFRFRADGTLLWSSIRLINTPPKSITIKRWVNVFQRLHGAEYEFGALHGSPEAARRWADMDKEFIATVPVEITFTPEE